MCVPVFVHVFLHMYDGLEFLAVGPVTRIAEGVRLIQFRYGPLENGNRVCMCVRTSQRVLMCVCCESLIKYFACINLEHSLNGASNSGIVPPLWAKQPPEWSASVADLAFYLSALPPSDIWIFHDSNLFLLFEMWFLAAINKTTMFSANWCTKVEPVRMKLKLAVS